MNNILFDLDGTLTDSVRGITNCFRYTLENLNRSVPSEAELLSFEKSASFTSTVAAKITAFYF